MTSSLSDFITQVDDQLRRNSKSPHLIQARTVARATASFLASNHVVRGYTSVSALESFDGGDTVVRNTDVTLGEGIDLNSIDSLLTNCGVADDAYEMRAMLTKQVAHLIIGAGTDRAKHFGAERKLADSNTAMLNMYGVEAYNMFNADAISATEAFGQDIDKVRSDFGLTLAITILKAFRNPIDRMLPRIQDESNLISIKIPEVVTYRLDKAADPSAAIRNKRTGDHLVPMINLYREPSPVNTAPKQVMLLKANDTNPSVLIADNILRTGVHTNVQDLALIANKPGWNAVDFTDLLSEGGSIESLFIKVTSGATTENFIIPIGHWAGARYTIFGNSADSADRIVNLTQHASIAHGALTASGAASAIFDGDYLGSTIQLSFNVNSKVSLKNGDISASGSVTATLTMDNGSAVAGSLATDFNGITFTIEGITPKLWHSEENLRKSTTMMKIDYREVDFEIPQGRTIMLDYSMQESASDTVISAISNANAIGNADRAIDSITSVMQRVHSANVYEDQNPALEFQYRIARNYAAGSLSLPYVIIDTLDFNKSNIAVMRESERPTELHAFTRARLLDITSQLLTNSLYHNNLNAGERPVFKLLAHAPLVDLLFGIDDYHNTLTDIPPGGRNAGGSDYSMLLQNGIRLDIYKTDFVKMRNTIIMFPVRDDSSNDDPLNLGAIRDRGTFVGKYMPVDAGSARNRIVTNSREIVYPTNPMGAILTVTNLNQTYPHA